MRFFLIRKSGQTRFRLHRNGTMKSCNPRTTDIKNKLNEGSTCLFFMCVNTYFDTICVHPKKSAYALSKFAYS